MPFFCYNKKDYCEHSDNCDNCDVWVLGKGGKEVPSKADRIRAMSDEEIAQWLCLNYSCTKCLGQELCTISDGKANGLLKWLKQPAEEVNDECSR